MNPNGKTDRASSHQSEKENKEREAMSKMIKVSIVCTIFMIAEALGGWIAGSLAIMTDAAHLFSDLSSFMISIFSIWIGQKRPSKSCTFGYQRAEVLGALTSVIVIWILTFFLIEEAIERYYHPVEIDARYMLITAIFGLVCNLVMIKVLHSGDIPHAHHGCSHGHNHNNIPLGDMNELNPVTESDNNKLNGNHIHSDSCGHSCTISTDNSKIQNSILDIEGEKDDLMITSQKKEKSRSHGQKPKRKTQTKLSERRRSQDKKDNNCHDHEHDHHHDHDHDHHHDHDNEHNHDHHHNHDHDHNHDHCGHGHDHTHIADSDFPHSHHDHDIGHSHGDEENVNVTAAIIHIIGDIVQSVGVVIAAILIYINQNWHVADPICTFIFSIIVFFTTINITRKCIRILMEAVPENINIDDIKTALREQFKDIIRIKDLLVWSISSGKVRAIVHIVSNNFEIAPQIKGFLKKKYKIDSSYVEIELEEDFKE